MTDKQWTRQAKLQLEISSRALAKLRSRPCTKERDRILANLAASQKLLKQRLAEVNDGRRSVQVPDPDPMPRIPSHKVWRSGADNPDRIIQAEHAQRHWLKRHVK